LFKNREKEITEINKGDEFGSNGTNETREVRPLANDKDHSTLDTIPPFMVEISIVT
jgi:hypothetical protein